MRPFSLSVHRYRIAKKKDEQERFGYADLESIEQAVKRYAIAKQRHKKGNFDPFSADPNCKTCGKNN